MDIECSSAPNLPLSLNNIYHIHNVFRQRDLEPLEKTLCLISDSMRPGDNSYGIVVDSRKDTYKFNVATCLTFGTYS
jgi:hypothetical protein